MEPSSCGESVLSLLSGHLQSGSILDNGLSAVDIFAKELSTSEVDMLGKVIARSLFDVDGLAALE